MCDLSDFEMEKLRIKKKLIEIEEEKLESKSKPEEYYEEKPIEITA